MLFFSYRFFKVFLLVANNALRTSSGLQCKICWQKNTLLVDVKVVTNVHCSSFLLILHLDTVISISMIIISISSLIMNNIMVIVISIRGGNIEQQHYRQ